MYYNQGLDGRSYPGPKKLPIRVYRCDFQNVVSGQCEGLARKEWECARARYESDGFKPKNISYVSRDEIFYFAGLYARLRLHARGFQ